MPLRIDRTRAVAVLALLLLAGCGGGPRGGQQAYRPVADLPVKIGPPYRIRGRTYVPADDRAYAAVGMASWYGSESGNRTANDERFRPDAIGAAHRTLPLPSYIEVSSLRTGRTILVRVNDRGPFAPARIVDLSRGAARQLGMERDGTIPVRVRRVFPSEADRAALRAGRAVSLRPPLSEAMRPALPADPSAARQQRRPDPWRTGRSYRSRPSPIPPARTGWRATSVAGSHPPPVSTACASVRFPTRRRRLCWRGSGRRVIRMPGWSAIRTPLSLAWNRHDEASPSPRS